METSKKNTLNLFIDGVKLNFLYYPYKLLEDFVIYKNVKISSTVDIACTKLITISSRGSKKDFIDLFVLLQTFTLSELFDCLEKKYEGVGYNKQHIMKLLVFFSDADNQPMPKLHIDTNWDLVKKTITFKANEIGLF